MVAAQIRILAGWYAMTMASAFQRTIERIRRVHEQITGHNSFVR